MIKNKDQAQVQRNYAWAVAEWLRDTDEYDIYAADILDCLACLGFTLIPSTTDEADAMTLAYIMELDLYVEKDS